MDDLTGKAFSAIRIAENAKTTYNPFLPQLREHIRRNERPPGVWFLRLNSRPQGHIPNNSTCCRFSEDLH